MTFSEACIDLIKRFAPLNFSAFHDEHGWQVGYACRDDRGVHIPPGLTVTAEEADEMCLERAARACEIVNNLCVELTQNELDALVCHVYFMPRMAEFSRSDIACQLTAGDKKAAAEAIRRDIRDAEIRRRTAAETELFLGRSGDGAA